MKRVFAALIASSVLGALFVAAPGIAGPEFKNKYENTTLTRDCGDDDTVTYAGPEKLWPPNHKLQETLVTATDADGSGNVTLDLTPSDVDDVAGGDGGTNHDPDIAYEPGTGMNSGDGAAEVTAFLRSERSGKGDGRTYAINWIVTYDDKTCSYLDEGQSPFIITVPHDMRGGADWK